MSDDGPRCNVLEIVDAEALQLLFDLGVDGANALQVVAAFNGGLGDGAPAPFLQV